MFLWKCLGLVFMAAAFDTISVQTHVSEVISSLERTDLSSASLFASASTICADFSNEIERNIAETSKKVGDLTYLLQAQVNPQLMKTRYRKMDVEQKMNENRIERKMLKEASENEKNHKNTLVDWVNSALQIAENDVNSLEVQKKLVQLKNNLLESQDFDAEIDQKLEELFIQFRNEYTSSTPMIIKLEVQVSQLSEEIENFNGKIKKYQEEEDILKKWCKVQNTRFEKEHEQRERQVNSASIFNQILVDMGGELADYVMERVNSALETI